MSCGQRTNRIAEGLRRSRSESAANGLEWTEATFIFKEAFLFGQGDTCLVSTSMTHFHHRHHHHHSSHGHHHGCHDDDEEEEEDPHWHDHQIEWFHDAHEWSNDNSSGHQEDEFSTPKGKDIVNSSRTTWPAASHSENPPVVAMHGHLMGNNPYNAYDRSHGGHFNRRAQRTHQKQVFASLLDDQDPQESANSIPSPPNEMDMGISSNDDLNFQTDDPKMDDDIAQENQINYVIQDDDQPLVESFANETDHDENNIREVFLKCPEDVKNLLRDRLEELAQNANQNTVRSCLGPSIDDALFRLFGVVRRWLNSWTSTAGSGECACGTECGAMTTCALKWLHHEYLGLADELVAASKLNDGGNETRRLASKRKLLDGLSKLLNDEHTQIEFAKIQSSSSPTSPSLVYDDDFEDTEEEVGNWDQNSSENSIIRESVQEANMNQMQAGLGALAQSSKPRGNICKGGCCGGGCSAGQNCQKMFLGDTRPVTNYSEMSRVSSNQEKNKPFYSSQAFHKQNLQRIFRMRRIEDSKPCICQKEDILVHGKRNSSRNSTTKRNSFNPSSFIGNLNPAFPGRMRNEERQKKKVSHRMRSKALEENFRGNDPLNSLTACRKPQYPHWPPQHQYNFDTSDPLLIVQNGSNEYEEQMRASKEMRHSTLPTNEEPADIYQEPPDTGCNNPCCEKLKSCAPYDVNNRSSLSDSGIPPVQSPTPPLREESKRISSATVNYNRNSTGDLKKTVPIADKIECPAKKEEEEMLLRIMTKLNLIEERLDREQTSKEVEPVKSHCLVKGQCKKEDPSIYCRCLVKGQCVRENRNYCPQDIEEDTYDTIPTVQEFSVPIGGYNNWNQYFPPRRDRSMNLTNSFMVFVNRTWQDLKSHFKFQTPTDILYDINVQDA